jgi:hypothetical protein
MKFSNKTALLSLIVLVLLTLLLIYITDQDILTVGFYANSGDPVAGIGASQEQTFEDLQHWIYLSSAIYLIIKLSTTSLILYTALYLAGHQMRFVEIFQVAVYSDAIFLIPATAKIIFFHIYYPHGTLTDWHKFYIGSALTFFDTAQADWNYALQTINLFEFAYWFALAFGIKQLTRLTYDRSLQIVLCSYVPALIIWIAAVTFFTLMMFPNTG